MKRTRPGKVVGSYKPPLDGWTYWAEKNWTTRENGFVVVAPSGARMEWVRDEAEALLIAETRNRDVYEVTIGEQTFRDHLYAPADGKFSVKLNEWEIGAVEAELAREEVVGWLRNVPRKSWAFKVPYTYNGEDAPMYPDFLFFRRQGDGIVVDILEPHSLHQDDSAAKAKGLADFALRHGDEFGRIELIIKEKDKLLRLDVNDGKMRDKVRAVSSNEHLRQLFESGGG